MLCRLQTSSENPRLGDSLDEEKSVWSSLDDQTQVDSKPAGQPETC